MPQHRTRSAPPRSTGFTLIEIMVVVAIIAILTAVAIPSYNDYMMRGNIPEATSRLAGLQVRMEQFYQDNRTYVGSAAGTLPCVSDTTTSRYFDFNCVAGAPTATTFTLQAVGKNSMAGFTYTVNQASLRTSTVAAPAPTPWRGTQANCWIVKKGAQC